MTIGLDTNVVVRYLVQDDPNQSKLANHIIEKAIANGEKLGISQVALCEIIWVLQRSYDVSKKELINVIKKLLQITQIQVQHDNIVKQALQDFENHSSIDFSDCLIGRQNTFNNCSFTYTFDKKAAKKLHSTFKLLN